MTASEPPVPPVPPVYSEAVRPAPQHEEPVPTAERAPRYQEPVQTVRRAPQYAEPERVSTAGERVDEYRRAVEEVRRLDEEKRERKKKSLIALLVVLVILLLGVVGVLAHEMMNPGAGWFGGNTAETTTAAATMVKVPDFKTSRITDIMNNQTFTTNFTIIQKAQSSDTVAEGTVLDQDILSGQMVPQGTVITLTVSSGAKMVKIPDVSGQTYEAAEETLKALGFKCSKSSRQNDGTHAPNTVAETSPLAGSEVKEGSLVMIVLWKDAETTAPVIDIGQQAQTTVPPTTAAPVTEAPTESTEPEPTEAPEQEVVD